MADWRWTDCTMVKSMATPPASWNRVYDGLCKIFELEPTQSLTSHRLILRKLSNPNIFHEELCNLDPDSLSSQKIEMLGEILKGKEFIGEDELF